MKLLLLAGTREARTLARRLSGDPRFEVLASLAGATQAPAGYAVALRRGGFGGADGLKEFIIANGFDAIVDATHPFARTMPARARTICAGLGRPCLRLLRPGWAARPGDVWSWVSSEADAADVIPKGARVFMATGSRSLPRFAALATGRHLIVRVIDRPDAPFPFEDGAWVVGRPPFSVESEVRTLGAHRVDVLVAKDSGGPTAAKLDAARALGLPVVLIRRPPPPPGDRVARVDDAVAWLERLL